MRDAGKAIRIGAAMPFSINNSLISAWECVGGDEGRKPVRDTMCKTLTNVFFGVFFEQL